MPEVSFILPAYKRRFLKEAIDSILAQTCREFELVVVDDKSPEGLYEVIREYPWEAQGELLPDGGKRWVVDGVPVRYYQNSENIGGNDLVAAWHHALEYATGEWCVLASDDDVYMPRYLAEMLRLAEKYPRTVLVHRRIVFMDSDGAWTSVGNQRIEYQTQVQMADSRSVRRLFQFAPDFMFRRTALEAIGGFVNFPLAWYSDDATWMMLAKNGVACSPEVLFGFRNSGENITFRTDNMELKIEAGERYRKWFADFCSGLKAENAEDEFLLKDMVVKTNMRITEQAISKLAHVRGFSAWWRLMKKVPLSGAERRGLVYARFPRLRALRMLVGSW